MHRMLRKLVALPVFYVFSRTVGFIGWIGGLINPIPIFDKLFDWVIGLDRSEQLRNEHEQALVRAVEAREIEYNTSKRILIEEVNNQREASKSRISRGESMISILIAVLAIWVGELPAETQLLFNITLPLPSLNAILLALVVLLVTSVFFRETVISTQAFTSPSVFQTYDELMTQIGWNGGTLSETRLGYNTLVLEIVREWDERFYDIYLELIADYVEEDGISLREAMERYGEDAYKIARDKYGF